MVPHLYMLSLEGASTTISVRLMVYHPQLRMAAPHPQSWTMTEIHVAVRGGRRHTSPHRRRIILFRSPGGLPT
jgi:hypothetical protein